MAGIAGAGGIGNILGIFEITQMIPPYWLQMVIGFYLIEIVFILTATLVTIKSGRDRLEKTAQTARNLKISVVLYFFVALFGNQFLIEQVFLLLLGEILSQ